MVRRWTWGLVPLSCAIACGTAWADVGRNGYGRFNGGPPTNPAPAEKERPKPKPIEKKPSETAAAFRAQEEANLLRRLAVCDRLKQLALEQGDSAMEQEAIRLEERATEVYRQRTKNLGPTVDKPGQEGGRK